MAIKLSKAAVDEMDDGLDFVNQTVNQMPIISEPDQAIQLLD